MVKHLRAGTVKTFLVGLFRYVCEAQKVILEQQTRNYIHIAYQLTVLSSRYYFTKETPITVFTTPFIPLYSHCVKYPWNNEWKMENDYAVQ